MSVFFIFFNVTFSVYPEVNVGLNQVFMTFTSTIISKYAMITEVYRNDPGSCRIKEISIQGHCALLRQKTDFYILLKCTASNS